jgi:K+-transporting ATPase ATPase A chain
MILYLSAWAAVAPYAVSSVNNAGPDGLSEILYAYSSGTGNNGSAFAGLNAHTAWWNVTLGLSMLVGRFVMIIPVLAMAGSLVGKRVLPPGPGTFPTDGLLFSLLLLGMIVIVRALTFFPALALGPVVEHFLAQHGRMF